MGPTMTKIQPVTKQWPKQRRWSANFGVGVIGGLVFACVALLIMVAIWVAMPKAQVEVPELAGLSWIKAEEMLGGRGLTVLTSSDEASEQPSGTVLRTDPAAGQKLDQGAGVHLVLATVAPPATVPEVAENPLPALESPAPQDSPRPQDSPAPQQPPGVVPPPVVVPLPVKVPPPVVVIPPAPGLRPVPEVIGLDRWRAARVLANGGLSVGSVTEEASSQRAGTVLRTNPRAGTAVWPGSSVNLVIAKVPPPSHPKGEHGGDHRKSRDHGDRGGDRGSGSGQRPGN